MIIKQILSYFILISFYFISLGVNAQEKQKQTDYNFNINADFVSRYIWRGQKLSETPAIQPGMSFSYKNLIIGTWASYSFGNEPIQEIDLFLSYQTGVFTFTLNDYFFLNNSLTDYVNYFDWNKNSTQHWLEAIVEISGINNLPVNLLAGVFIAGADVDNDINPQYSTYIELSYDFKVKNIENQIFAGFTPFKGYYSDAFDFVNIGFKTTKSIPITEKFSLPVSGALIINPANRNIMFQAVISI